MTIKIDPKAIDALTNFTLPTEIGFGKTIVPIMAVTDYKDGVWSPLELLPYAPIVMDPTCKVLHYGQEIFEGMKAYHVEEKGPYLFRPMMNAKRFNLSAQRMAMPDIPEELYMEAVRSVVEYSTDFIPTKSGESLYLRPFMIATENSLGIKPSDSYKFMVIASPSGSYFKNEALKVLIEREFIRASPGGMGYAKTGGNYAGSLISAKKARDLGYEQTLWLDGLEKKYIEEMSGMNFFAVIDGKIVTPTIQDTILDGITRNSLITIAKDLGYEVSEEKFEIEKLLSSIEDGSCTECFACGTAAIITPIGLFGDCTNNTWEVKNPIGPVSSKLKETLLALQEGRLEDKHEWRMEVK
ncbi:branched-chain amino acid aminotransferase [Halobacteriovorax sp. HLS]|uniref:branched-chain amino acid aminotransferase n=1 Tax=Halobacteriovorax sp. HLS TaxID=2234000 RepID=UPI000FD97363|nr:branched-chain amino acid aminotransferase [Halobacteriovorax sp. HLS]